MLFTCILPFLEERRAHAADGRRGSSVCRTHLEQEGCSVTPRGERGGGRGGELFEFYATFNLRSIFLCDRGKKKKGRKRKKVRRYTIYIYIIYTLLTVRKLSFCDHSSILALSRPGTEYSKGRIAIIARLSQVSRKAR